MAVLNTPPPRLEAMSSAPAEVVQRKFRPVVAWATVGALSLLVELYSFFGWWRSGEMKRTPIGPTKVPEYTTITVRILEIGSPIALAACLWFFLIRPWWRNGRRLTLDGLFLLVYLTIWWQDAGLNFFQVWSTYSSAWWNVGAWYPHIPGWVARRANFTPEPLIFVIPVYVYCVFGLSVFGCYLMRKAHDRWPRVGNFGLVVGCIVGFTIFDSLLEGLLLRTGFYTFAGTPDALTLFKGHFFEFPMHEGVMVGLWWGAFCAARYFRNDKGQTIAERGIDRVSGSPRKITFIRFLALVGIINVSFLAYNVPAAITGIYAGPWPDDAANRSYLNQEYCGVDTKFACTGPGVPIPRPNSAQIGVDGHLVDAHGNPISTAKP